jgi:Uncharacterised protein family (UPF0158)
MRQLVKLSEIIEVIDLPSEELTSYLNIKTGQIITIKEEDIRTVEDGDTLDDYPEWQLEDIRATRDFLDNEDDYLSLPTKFDLDEYGIMEKFCLSVEDMEMSETLYSPIKGKGAFRRFKDTVHRLDLADEWYKYRDQAIRQIAIDWCDLHKIKFIDT